MSVEWIFDGLVVESGTVLTSVKREDARKTRFL